MKYYLYSTYFILALLLFACLSWFEKKLILFYFSFFSNKWFVSKMFDFSLYLDWMKCWFLVMLFIITGSVGHFSMIYMEKDSKNIRFLLILKLFVLSMVFLLVLPHYVFFLMGWDGLGFSSFLLIKYYKSKNAWASSLKTFLINRLGDGLLLGSMGLIMYQGHFFFFFSKKSYFLWFVILLGLLTKSAHFPFSSWLPAAMAAPTPVSALVHSSTLVTAGIYMILRLTYYFPSSMNVFFFVLALLTMVLGSFKAFSSYDSKKVIAYSTLSNLGLLGVSLSLGFIGLSFFHLLTHGVSKALLFITTGHYMKNNNHIQDLRGFSKMSNKTLLTNISIFISILSLMGGFFLSCYYSKDAMLEYSVLNLKMISVVLMKISMIFTFLYSLRLIKFFFKKNNKQIIFFFKPYLNSSSFYISILPLTVCIIFFGSFFSNYIFSYHLSVKIVSIFIILTFLLTPLFFKMKLSFINKFKVFNSSMFFKMSFLGNIFIKNIDSGLFSQMMKFPGLFAIKLNFIFNSMLNKFSLNLKIYLIFFFFFCSLFWF